MTKCHYSLKLIKLKQSVPSEGSTTQCDARARGERSDGGGG